MTPITSELRDVSLAEACRITGHGERLLRQVWNEIPTAWRTASGQYRVAIHGLREWQQQRSNAAVSPVDGTGRRQLEQRSSVPSTGGIASLTSPSRDALDGGLAGRGNGERGRAEAGDSLRATPTMTPEQIAAWTRDLAAFRPEWDVRYDMLDFGTLYVSSTLMRVWGMKWHDHALVTARRMVALGLMREHEILERPLPPHGAMYRFEKISREPGSRS